MTVIPVADDELLLIDIRTAAKRLSMSVSLVEQLIHDGRLEAIRVPKQLGTRGRYYVEPRALSTFIQREKERQRPISLDALFAGAR